MPNPAALFASLARCGVLESATVHAPNGDVLVDVGVQETSAAVYDFASGSNMALELLRSAVTLDVGTELTFRDQRWRVLRQPENNGPFMVAHLQVIQ